jgi:hypothetical protein
MAISFEQTRGIRRVPKKARPAGLGAGPGNHHTTCRSTLGKQHRHGPLNACNPAFSCRDSQSSERFPYLSD